MLFLTFQFCYAVIYIQLEVGLIIIWLFIGGATGLENKQGDVVLLEKMRGPIIKMAVMSVKEEDLLIELTSTTGPTEETHLFHRSIPVHIYRRRVVD